MSLVNDINSIQMSTMEFTNFVQAAHNEWMNDEEERNQLFPIHISSDDVNESADCDCIFRRETTLQRDREANWNWNSQPKTEWLQSIDNIFVVICHTTIVVLFSL